MSTRLPHPQQYETGLVRRKNKTLAARSAGNPFRQATIPESQQLGAASCQLRAGTRADRYGRQAYTAGCILGARVGYAGGRKSGGGLLSVRMPLPDSRVFFEFVTFLP
jgi:hypothetical protein